MKLLIDLSSCDLRYSSITVLSLRILKGFVDNGVGDVTILCNTVVIDAVKEICSGYEIVPIEMTRRISAMNLLKSYWRWRKIVKGIDYDVIYLPHPFPPFHCIYNKGRIVTTMLDIEGLKSHKGIKLIVFKLVYQLALRRSHRLTTISEFVRQDILKTYPFVLEDSIKAVHCSVVVGTPLKADSPLNDKYILYVSSFLRHKNVFTLVRAFSLLRDQIPHKLVLIGRENDLWQNEVIPYIKINDLTSRIVHIGSGVTDNDLARWYKHADLFVHPSYMEGFGYPPVEAAILGAPVITTKETSLEEVTMGLLNYYEPATDEHALANKILDVLQNRPSIEKLKEISEIYKKEYEYRKIAKELYNELLITID